jgi:tRNA(Ile)-lysidine synthase
MISNILYQKFHYNVTSLLGNKLDSLAIAVSGGSDSVALLILLNELAQKHNTKLLVMHVNHNLRTESKCESKYVKELTKKLGHSYYEFSWDAQGNLSNLQERAREGRYKLITDYCLQLDVLTLVTAHHQDDYIENFCIRLERKSGVFGLSRSNTHFYNNIRILRPLHNIEKQELVDYLKENNVKWFEDSSNLSEKYHRNRIRKYLADIGHSSKQNILIKQQEVDNLVAKTLRLELISAIADSVIIYPLGFAKVNLLFFQEYNKEVQLQLLNFVLMAISGNNHMPRLSILIRELTGFKKKFTKTLHGCAIKIIENNLLIYREFGKTPPQKVSLNDGAKWDNRFRFQTKKSIENAYITYLTMKDYSDIKDRLDLKELRQLTTNNHLRVLFTLPAIKILEKVLALPHISYYNDSELVGKCRFSFEPSFISRFLHFC